MTDLDFVIPGGMVAPEVGTPAAFSGYFKNEIARWAKVSKHAGARIE